MTTQKKQVILINLLYFAVILAIVIFICRKGLPLLLPFLIALLVSLLLRPVVGFLRDKCHVSKELSAIVIVILFYALVGFLLSLLGTKLISTLGGFITSLPHYYNTKIEPLLIHLNDWALEIMNKLDPESSATVTNILNSAAASLESSVSSFSVTAVKKLTSVVISLPSFLLNIIIMLAATIFISMDFPLIRRFIAAQLKPKTRNMIREVVVRLRDTLGKYARSYALIMLISFVELSIGFLIIGIKNWFVLALLIAVLDIFPIVGCGTALIPWAIISALNANYRLATSLAILYVIITVIRNYIEPRIVGETVGLHPLVALLCMVVGTYVFGPIGLLGLPIAAAVIKGLNDSGMIHWFKKTDPKDKPEEKKPESDKPENDVDIENKTVETADAVLKEKT